MDNKKNYIDLSKYNTRNNNNNVPEETLKPTKLSQLFKEPEDEDPIEAQAARDRRFGRTPSVSTNQSGSFKPK